MKNERKLFKETKIVKIIKTFLYLLYDLVDIDRIWVAVLYQEIVFLFTEI